MSLALAIILVVHLAVTGFMTGLIWLVQVVHYPLFHRVGEATFIEYERMHVRVTGRVVGPAMVLEAFSAALLVALIPTGSQRWMACAGLGLLSGIWLSTALLQAPCHNRLKHGYDAATVERLTRTNWLRTIAWSLRLLFAAALVLVGLTVASR